MFSCVSASIPSIEGVRESGRTPGRACSPRSDRRRDPSPHRNSLIGRASVRRGAGSAPVRPSRAATCAVRRVWGDGPSLHPFRRCRSGGSEGSPAASRPSSCPAGRPVPGPPGPSRPPSRRGGRSPPACPSTSISTSRSRHSVRVKSSLAPPSPPEAVILAGTRQTPARTAPATPPLTTSGSAGGMTDSRSAVSGASPSRVLAARATSSRSLNSSRSIRPSAAASCNSATTASRSASEARRGTEREGSSLMKPMIISAAAPAPRNVAPEGCPEPRRRQGPAAPGSGRRGRRREHDCGARARTAAVV